MYHSDTLNTRQLGELFNESIIDICKVIINICKLHDFAPEEIFVIFNYCIQQEIHRIIKCVLALIFVMCLRSQISKICNKFPLAI